MVNELAVLVELTQTEPDEIVPIAVRVGEGAAVIKELEFPVAVAV